MRPWIPTCDPCSILKKKFVPRGKFPNSSARRNAACCWIVSSLQWNQVALSLISLKGRHRKDEQLECFYLGLAVFIYLSAEHNNINTTTLIKRTSTSWPSVPPDSMARSSAGGCHLRNGTCAFNQSWRTEPSGNISHTKTLFLDAGSGTHFSDHLDALYLSYLNHKPKRNYFSSLHKMLQELLNPV